MFGSGREPSRRSGSGREAITEVREWPGGPTGGPGVFWESFLTVRECSGGPPRGLGVVRKPYRRSGSGLGALPEVWAW